MFKVNNKNTRTRSVTTSIVDFEQVIVSWIYKMGVLVINQFHATALFLYPPEITRKPLVF